MATTRLTIPQALTRHLPASLIRAMHEPGGQEALSLVLPGLMPTSGPGSNARDQPERDAMCAMTSSCNVTIEVGSAGAGRVRIQA